MNRIRQALRIGLPQFVARFQPSPLWVEERIREALTERAVPVTPAQFEKNMKTIAHGRCCHQARDGSTGGS